jgi:hypothetical protein
MLKQGRKEEGEREKDRLCSILLADKLLELSSTKLGMKLSKEFLC